MITAVTSCFAQLFVLLTEEFFILLYLRGIYLPYILKTLFLRRSFGLSSAILGLTTSLVPTWAAFLLVLCARLRFSHVIPLLIVTC